MAGGSLDRSFGECSVLSCFIVADDEGSSTFNIGICNGSFSTSEDSCFKSNGLGEPFGPGLIGVLCFCSLPSCFTA